MSRSTKKSCINLIDFKPEVSIGYIYKITDSKGKICIGHKWLWDKMVKGNFIKTPTKTKAQQKQHDIQDKVGKSLNNPEVKDLVGTRSKK